MGEAAFESQNWEALLKLELRRGQDRTHLLPLKRHGPLTVQRPFYPEQDCCHVYLLHPPGGVVGGDRLDLQVSCKDDTRALFTTPGAGKFYFSAAETAHVTQQFKVGSGAQLEFLPQESIYFPGARVRCKTSIDVQTGGGVMLWEKHCFGRPANNEFFATGQLHSQIELRSEERLLFTETQRIDADELQRTSGLRKCPVIGSFLVYGIELEQTMLRDLQASSPIDGLAGITQPQPHLLIARYLGNSTRDVDAYFVGLWELLRPLVLQREASHPRIWKT
ncbi:MAG: urease accessory protein UreD [Gammaproteobacteria bacterium]|nr:urease accessory protein UreD [Gammaproteobacteria bacterium]